MLANGPRLSPAMVRGVLPELEVTVSDVGEKIRGGDAVESLQPDSQNILLGRSLAGALGVRPAIRC